MAESRSRSRRSEQGGRRKNRKKHKAPSTVRTRRSPLRPVLPAASSEHGALGSSDVADDSDRRRATRRAGDRLHVEAAEETGLDVAGNTD